MDLDAGRIVVRWQVTDKSYRAAIAAEKRGERGRYRTKPKTRAGEDRIVDLDALSVKVLRDWRKTQFAERQDWGPAYVDPLDDDTPYNLVFTRENGAPLDPGQTYGTVGQRAAEATAALVPRKTKPGTSKSRRGKKRKGDDGSSGVLARVG